MSDDMIKGDYEFETGYQIINCFNERKISYEEVEMVLVGNHAPFAWGTTPEKAVENAIVLEFAAQMAWNSYGLNPSTAAISKVLLDKHFLRKHGRQAYYGQP